MNHNNVTMSPASVSEAIMLLNRNLPTRCQKTSLRAFISWIAGMALSRMMCAYSIGAPIGAVQISWENHYSD